VRHSAVQTRPIAFGTALENFRTNAWWGLVPFGKIPLNSGWCVCTVDRVTAEVTVPAWAASPVAARCAPAVVAVAFEAPMAIVFVALR
jgi:hypothetical protein